MQTFVEDDVIVQRSTMKRNDRQNDDSKKNGHNRNKDIQEPDEDQVNDVLEIKIQKQFRIISVLLFMSALIIFLSMISYSPKDEANTGISISEFFRLIAGDGFVRAKFEGIINWLGIFGALTANLFYNNTLGYVTIFIPFIMVLWAKEFFVSIYISRKLGRRTLIYLIYAVIFATFMGTIQHISLFSELPKEWSGAIGQFLSTIFYGFIGAYGTTLLLFAGAIIAFIFGTDIDINEGLKKLNLSQRQPFKFIIDTKSKFLESVQLASKPKTKPNPSNEHNQESIPSEAPVVNKSNIREFLPVDDTEPAQIIRRNLNMNNLHNRSNITSRILNRENVNPLKIIKETESYDKHPSENFEIPDIDISEKTTSKPEESFIKNSYLRESFENNEPETIGSIEENPREILERKRKELLNKLRGDVNETAIKHESGVSLNKFKSDIHKVVPITQENEFESIKKPLTLTVRDVNRIDEFKEPSTPLSTLIHDMEIDYIPPSKDLLIDQDEFADVNDEELSENAKILREKLETFKIDIDNLSVTPGPVVTQYEFVPAPGIKVSRIESLADDIAMALKAKGIRIIAPIPGKGTVGIEIPNRNPSIVRFSSIIKSSRFHQSDQKLPLALGKTIGGEVYCADLAKMPHLLIAGSTGSGKSVGINTILASLLYKKHPSELKFVIVDPKKVELNQYSVLEKHFIASSPDLEDLIITSPEDAVVILKSVCAEMDKRYDILASVGQRNILDYNRKVKSGKYKDDKEMAHRSMPYIVVIIDELADLMLTASKEVEAPIIRIAQLARAVGIHLVLATQRPSVDVITGIIKANFPARMSYLVASKIDSRTILDQSGAEQLLGNGDMLFLPGGSPKPVRIQNSFISTDEVEAICEHIGNQIGYSKPYLLPSLIEKSNGKNGISKEDRDPLFEDAAKMLIGLQQASVSIIQRRLKVGYARAGKIIDELEDAGVVGPYAGSKARDILMESESELEAVL